MIRADQLAGGDEGRTPEPLRRSDQVETLWGKPPPREVLDRLPFHDN